jgi:hypothetical protein
MTVGHDLVSLTTVGGNRSGAEEAPQDNPVQRTSNDLEQQDRVEPEATDTDGENQSDVDQPFEPALEQQARVEPEATDADGENQSDVDQPKETKERELTEDTFSFLFVTPWTMENRHVLVTAVGIWILQMTIYILVLVNSIEKRGSSKLGFPSDVDASIRAAEVRRLLQSIHPRFSIP